jgi:hypothetical protein
MEQKSFPMFDRERLEDEFDRADGAQEVAFRAWRRAKNTNTGALIARAEQRGRAAHAALVCLAAEFAKPRR